MNRQELISAMEQAAQEALQKLESFNDIQADYKRTVKALKALTGDYLKPGRKTQGKKGLTATTVAGILKAHPKGLTLQQIQEILAKQHKIVISTNAIYSSFRSKAKATAIPGSVAKIYQLKASQ